jgi:uncharacterized membrane-anchored protein
VLGRRGVLSLNAVGGMSKLPEIEEHMTDVMQLVAFNQGERYADFQPGVDKVLFKGFTAAEIRAALHGQETVAAPSAAGPHHAPASAELGLDLGHGDTLDLAGVAHLGHDDIVIG